MTRPLLVPTLLLLAAGCTAIPQPRASKYHVSDADLSVTRIVHASAVLELGGARVLVDPWFHSGLFVRQSEALGLLPDSLPTLAAILLTGDAAERFDAHALADLAQKVAVPVVIAPASLLRELTDLGFPDVRALGPWDATTLGNLTITAVPTSRGPRQNGYLVASAAARAYVAGDTRYFPELVDVATAFPGVDVALLPIGGERVLGVAHQMTPAEAARAAVLLKPRYVIPMAYGAADLPPLWWSDGDAVSAFRDAAAAAGIPGDRIVPLEPGESWHYYPTAVGR